MSMDGLVRLLVISDIEEGFLLMSWGVAPRLALGVVLCTRRSHPLVALSGGFVGDLLNSVRDLVTGCVSCGLFWDGWVLTVFG